MYKHITHGHFCLTGLWWHDFRSHFFYSINFLKPAGYVMHQQV